MKQNITSISFKDERHDKPQIIYAAGLGKVRDLIKMLPLLNTAHPQHSVSPFSVFRTPLFFLDGSKKESYESVQILSSLGIYSGIVINENADWEKLTDLMYYALCGRIPHAPIEPFQYVYDTYQRNRLVDYGVVYEAENGERKTGNGERNTENGERGTEKGARRTEKGKKQNAEGRRIIPLQFFGGVDAKRTGW
jgi:hypothetical protein